jgi:hypothetical protein
MPESERAFPRCRSWGASPTPFRDRERCKCGTAATRPRQIRFPDASVFGVLVAAIALRYATTQEVMPYQPHQLRTARAPARAGKASSALGATPTSPRPVRSSRCWGSRMSAALTWTEPRRNRRFDWRPTHRLRKPQKGATRPENNIRRASSGRWVLPYTGQASASRT